jgi:hypothetical protein
MSTELGIKRHRSELEWREIYEDHMVSGNSISEFCKIRGIAPSSYSKWYQRFSCKEVKRTKFKELLREETKMLSKKVELELDLGNGIKLRVLR